MSAGIALPRQVFGHGWVHLKGEKMSKSLGTAVEPLEAHRSVRPRSAAAVSRPRRSRSAATATSPGSATRIATTSIWPTTSATWSAASRAMAEKYRGGSLQPAGQAGTARGSRGQGGRRLPAGDGRVRARSAARRPRFRSSTRPTSSSRAPSRGRSRGTRRGPAELSQVLFDVAEAVRVAGDPAAARSCRSRPQRFCGGWARRGRRPTSV